MVCKNSIFLRVDVVGGGVGEGLGFLGVFFSFFF